MEGLRGLTGHQVVGVLRERYAAEARAHAATLAAVWETVLCADPDSRERLSDPDEWSTDEVRAALGLTRAAANRLAGEAHQMFHRLPELGEAMAAGTLDPPRARVIADWTTELSDPHAHQVAAEVLTHCRLDEQTRLTTGQLAEEIKVQAIALDPEWARRRYERSIADRKVMGSRTPDGTAKLSGTNLPLERVAASVARLDDLAKSAKRAGDPRPIDHLRADLFLGMTDGTYRGLDDGQIPKALLAAPVDEPATPTPGGHPPEPTPQPQPQPEEPAPSWPGTHVKVRLTTLLGLDRYPAELAGWAPIHAELARETVHQLGAGQWRFTFTCPSGHLLRTGLLTARPVGSDRRRASCEGVVEILVPVALLPRLLPHLCAGDRAGDLAATVAPGCRAPATSADLDHRLDHAKGGRTVGENLNPHCAVMTTASKARPAGNSAASATPSSGRPASATSTSCPSPRCSPTYPNSGPARPRTTCPSTPSATASAVPGRPRPHGPSRKTHGRSDRAVATVPHPTPRRRSRTIRCPSDRQRADGAP